MWLLTVQLSRIGGMAPLSFSMYLEWPLILYLFWLFNVYLQPTVMAPVIAALPITLAYLIHDSYYIQFGQVVRFVNIKELPELIDVLPPLYLAGFAATFVAPLGLFIWQFRWQRRLIGFTVPLLALLVILEIFPVAYATAFNRIAKDIQAWSDKYDVDVNGRLAMLLYHEGQRLQFKAEATKYYDRPHFTATMHALAGQLSGISRPRNIHLIVLESFVDPTLFAGATFSTSPQHPDFQRLVGNNMGISISPVFGGGTAQAEFEALCGVPAFRDVVGTEFNAFSGHAAAAWCLPGILHQMGWRTIASNAHKPNFFNAIKAYEGMGFDEIYFPKENAPNMPTYFSRGVLSKFESYMFDGTLFDQNLAYLARTLKEHPGQPVLNYILTAYGHFPHTMTDPSRPQFIRVMADTNDEHFRLAVNQHYYRTQAMARYIEAIHKMDPNGLIVFISDHVPPLLKGNESYKALRYLNNEPGGTFKNRLLIFVDGKPTTLPTIHHYDIPSLVLNYVTSGRYCTDRVCNLQGERKTRDQYRGDYLRTIAHAIKE